MDILKFNKVIRFGFNVEYVTKVELQNKVLRII